MPLHRKHRHSLWLMSFALVVGVFVPGHVRAEAEPLPPSESEPDDLPPRYIVEFEPGALPVNVNLDHPEIGEISREVVLEAIADEVVGDGGEVVYDYDEIPFVAVETENVSALWALPGVIDVEPEVVVTRALSSSLDVIEASDSDLDAAIGGVRADGTGVAVAIIDDGIDRTHPFFMENGQSRVVAEACFTRGACQTGTGTADQKTGPGSAAHHAGDYHGTHVAGIAAGNSQGVGPVARGVAANADIVAVQVFNSAGSAYSIDIDRALNWIYNQVSVGALNVVSINMSLGGSYIYSGDCSTGSTTHTAVANLAAVGVTVVVASGNSGSQTGVSWPACLNNVVPVGSTTDNNQISSFSNVGSQIVSRGVLAPGSSICSSVPQVVLASGYGCLNGTSMAAPHVAGLVALVRQASTSATVGSVRSALRTTGVTISGMPRITAWTAIGAVLPNQGELTGVITDTTGPSVALTQRTMSVQLSSGDRSSGPGSVTSSIRTDGVGTYRLRLPSGTWTSTFTYCSYQPSTTLTSSVTAGGVVTRAATVSAGLGSIAGTIQQPSAAFTNATFRLVPLTCPEDPEVIRTVNPLAGSGSFELTNLRVGQWSLSVTSGEASSGVVTASVSAGVSTSVTSPIELAYPTGAIEVVLTDSISGGPVQAAVDVIATPVAPVGTRLDYLLSSTSSASGALALPRIRTGSWSVSISALNYAARTVSPVAVNNGVTTSVAVSLDPLPGSVEGGVSDPWATAEVGIQSIVVDEIIDLTLTPVVPTTSRSVMTLSRSLASTGGRFTIQNVVPGEWNLVGSVFGYEDVTRSAVIVTPNGVVDTGTFTLIRRTAVRSVNPASGATTGGDTVTITGAHLSGATLVTFGGTAATVVSVANDGKSMVVRTPAKSAGSAAIVVTTPLGQSSDVVGFSFVDPTPAPSPVSGGGGGGGGGGGTPSPSTQAVTAGPGASPIVQLGLAFGVVRLNFAGLRGPGSVTVTPKAGLPVADSGGIVLPGYWLEITSSVPGFDLVEVCAPIQLDNLTAYGITVEQLRLFHWENNVRKDVTTRLDTANNRVCGLTKSFSPFAVGALRTARTAGVDRYETAARLSASSFQPGVSVAYVVTGEKFPDALAAGAAAGREGGPVLLVRSNSLPQVTANELKRVAPKRVIVVGGQAVVSESVIDAIEVALPGVPVERVGGVDRYDTSAKLSQRTFSATDGTVYIGSGLGFTEILAGSAAAGRDKAPLLLVPGTGPGANLPLSVAVELKRLNPRSVVVLGGTGLVAVSVVDAVKKMLPGADVNQISGVDAYETAAKVARTFTSGGTIYVATGAVFADGLAGGAAAATRGHPLVMVPPSGELPVPVKQALAQLRPTRIVVLGGTSAIARDVENSVAAYLP